MEQARSSRIRALCSLAVAAGFAARASKMFKPAPRHGLAGTLLDVMEDAGNAVRRRRIRKAAEHRAAFDPDQARDDKGQWTKGSGGGQTKIESTKKAAPKLDRRNMDKALKAISRGEKSRDKTKREVMRNVAKRMAKNDPEFAKFSKRDQEFIASDITGTWADTSGDHSPEAVALQMAIAKEFGLEKTATLAHTERDTRGDALRVLKSNADEHFGLFDDDSPNITVGRVMMNYARAQYDETQAFLRSRGIKDVTVVRGANYDNRRIPTGRTSFSMQPASSWTVKEDIATDFASGGYIHGTRVPRTQVLSTWRTGMGCQHERELTLLGRQTVGLTVHAPYSDYFDDDDSGEVSIFD